MSRARACSRQRFLRNHRGQALIPVVFVILILTSLAVTLGVRAHREAQAAVNFANRSEEFAAARGAVIYAASMLAETSNNGANYGVITAPANVDSNGWWQMGDAWVKVDSIDTGAFINLNAVSATTLETLPVFQENPQLAQAIVDWRTPVSTGTPSASAGSENTAYEGSSQPYELKGAPFDTVQELLLVQGMTPSILYGTPAGQPATSATPQGVSPQDYGAAPGRAASRQAGGGAPSGGGGAGSGPAAGGSAAEASAAAQFASIYQSSTMPLEQLFSVAGRSRNVAADGSARVNINSASAQQLEQQLGLTQQQANAIVTYRQGSSSGGASGGAGGAGGPAGGAGAPGGAGRPGGAAGAAGGARPGAGAAGPGGGAPGGGPGTRQAIAGGSQAGAGVPGGQGATGGAETGSGGAGPARPGQGTSGTGQSSGTAQNFNSAADLLQVQEFTPQVVQQIADKVSTSSSTYRPSVVDVNTAPPEVLATVPGMDTTLLNAILQARQGGNYFQTIGDVIALPGVSPATLRAALPYLDTRSIDYVIRVRVRVPGSDAVYAAVALVELTPQGPSILQWREVSRFPGWSLWQPYPSLPPPPTPPASQSANQSSAQQPAGSSGGGS